DETHPSAFRRMLRLILDNDLIRFSATMRAVDVWFGFGWEAASTRTATAILAQFLQFLEDPEERDAAMGRRGDRATRRGTDTRHPTPASDPSSVIRHPSSDANGETIFLALCTLAHEDAMA